MARALPALAPATLVFRASERGGRDLCAQDRQRARRASIGGATRSALRNHIHGLSPSPGAYSEIDLGRGLERVKFLRVAAVEGSGAPGTSSTKRRPIACGDGAIRILEAQRAGKTAMSGEEFQRGAQIEAGRSIYLIVSNCAASFRLISSLARFGGAQDLRRPEEIEHPELLDRRPHENVGRPELQLLRGDRALHDLRRARTSPRTASDFVARARAAESDVDRNDDIGGPEQHVIGQRIDGAAVDQRRARPFRPA